MFIQPLMPAACTSRGSSSQARRHDLCRLPAADVQQHLASLGTVYTPEQHAQFAANQAASEKQLQAQGVKL